MDKSTIIYLNRLNKKFYQKVATSFSNSRSYYWQGWNKLVPYLQDLAKNFNHQINVIDIGCGNGRFSMFLAQQLPSVKINYLGIDNNDDLLNIAKSLPSPANLKLKFKKIDLVKDLLENSLINKIAKFQPNFICILGVTHHIPSLKLRIQLIKDLTDTLINPGYLTFTTWNFLINKRFEKKIISPTLVNLNQQQLENNDLILDWRKDMLAYRYCHYTDSKELIKIIKATSLENVSQFYADGKNNKLNTYTILKK